LKIEDTAHPGRAPIPNVGEPALLGSGIVNLTPASRRRSTRGVTGISAMQIPNTTLAANQGVLTLINTRGIDSHVASFTEWLNETGASPVTARNYTRAIYRWAAVLTENADLRPASVWRKWSASRPMKRLTGYACRRWVEFCGSVLGETVDMGIPNRLPGATRPCPRPLNDNEFRCLLLAAKQILPEQTPYTFPCGYISWTKLASAAASPISNGMLSIGRQVQSSCGARPANDRYRWEKAPRCSPGFGVATASIRGREPAVSGLARRPCITF